MQWRARLALLIAAVTIGIGTWVPPSLSQEAPHPELRRKAEADERRRADESRRNEERIETESRKAADRAAREGLDFNKRYNTETVDAKTEADLDARFKERQAEIEANRRRSQAEHAMERRESTELNKRGIYDAEQLEKKADEIRSNPDISRQINDSKTAYGKFDDDGKKSGIIVLDNMNAGNGGTVMTNNDIKKRIEGIK